MNNLKNYIIVGLISILIGFGIILSIKCSNLEKENLKLKTENLFKSDSIKIENKSLEKEIISLSENLNYYKFKIDSLNNVKQKIIIKTEYIVSENLTESVILLKDNLKCEKY